MSTKLIQRQSCHHLYRGHTLLWIHLLCIPSFDTLFLYYIRYVSVFTPTWIVYYPSHHSLLLASPRFCCSPSTAFPIFISSVHGFIFLRPALCKSRMSGATIKIQTRYIWIEARRYATSANDYDSWLVRTSGFYTWSSEFKHLSEVVFPNRGMYWMKKANLRDRVSCNNVGVKFSKKNLLAASFFRDHLPETWRQQFYPPYFYQGKEIRCFRYLSTNVHTHRRNN